MIRLCRLANVTSGLASISCLLVIGQWLFAEEAQPAVEVKNVEAKNADAVAADDAQAVDANAKDAKSKEAMPEQAKTEKKKRKPAAANGAAIKNFGGLLQEVLGGGQPVNPPFAPRLVQPEDERPEAERLQDPIVQQFIQSNRNRLYAELRFVRLVCDQLTPEQRRPIREAGENALKQFGLRIGAHQRQMQRGGVAASVDYDSGQMIREALEKSLREKLTDEQFARFQGEAQKRNELRKRSIIMSVVTFLDDRLMLNEEQRQKIVASLTSRWQHSWEKWSMMQMYGGRYLPMIPEDCVGPHLNAEQKTVWNGIPKVDFSWWNIHMHEPRQADDDWWGFDDNNGAANQGVIFGVLND